VGPYCHEGDDQPDQDFDSGREQARFQLL
jgi:hypothetical protein